MNAATPLLPSPEYAPPASPTSLLLNSVQSVLKKTETAQRQAFLDKTERNVLIGVASFSCSYLLFQGILSAVPAAGDSSAFASVSCAFGLVAGVLSMARGLVSLANAIRAFKIGDKKLATRFLIEALGRFLLSILMITVSVSLKTSILGGFASFCAMPWLFPMILTIMAIPLVLELKRQHQIVHKRLNQLKNNELNEWFPEKATENDVQDQMHLFQSEVGIEAAIAIFKLWEAKLNEQDTIKEKENVQNMLLAWRKAVRVRTVQQLVYTLSAALGIAAYAPGLAGVTLKATGNFVTCVDNATSIPLIYYWPFKISTRRIV